MKIEWNIQTSLATSQIYQLMQLAADCALVAEGVALPCGMGVHIVNEREIQRLNGLYRGINLATDVLSFPQINYPEGKKANEAARSLRVNYDDSLKAVMLGDLFFSMQHIISQAVEYGHALEREAAYLCAHGVFHLLGYDHINENEKQEMRIMEEKALNMMGLGREEKEKITDQQLVLLAKQAMERSYSPYSNYPVGSALLSKDGRVFLGCNIENASFGLSNCGERTAVFKAVSEGVTEFEAIAIASKNSAPWPCGACRQVLNEFAPDIRVLVTWGDNQVAQSSLDTLFPHGFGPKDLA